MKPTSTQSEHEMGTHVALAMSFPLRCCEDINFGAAFAMMRPLHGFGRSLVGRLCGSVVEQVVAC